MTSLYAAIPKIIDRFDFKQVHKVMTFLNWTWAGNTAVPTIFELEDQAQSLLNMAVQLFEERGCPASGMLVATGGFEATVQCYESGESQLQLLFYVDSCSDKAD